MDVLLSKKSIIEHGGKNNNENFKLVFIIIEPLTSLNEPVDEMWILNHIVFFLRFNAINLRMKEFDRRVAPPSRVVVRQSDFLFSYLWLL